MAARRSARHAGAQSLTLPQGPGSEAANPLCMPLNGLHGAMSMG
jgi:hypothetical protein